jgi:predicted component of type VI protein secretion system
MRRFKLVVLVALLAVSLVLFGCSSSAPNPRSNPLPALSPTPVPQSLELTVLHTNDTLGFTEPCG